MVTKFKILVSILLGSVLLPAFAFARVGVEAGMQASTTVKTNLGLGASFCTNLPTLSTQITTRLTNGQNKLGDKQKERVGNVDDRESRRAKELTDLRLKADADRQAIYVKLNAKATTELQKQAVVQFQTTIEAAVSTRRLAVDAAIKAYWTAVDEALKNRQSSLQSAEQAFQDAIKAALATAQTECANGTASVDARAHFAASVKAAQTKFQTDRKAIDKFGAQVKALSETRNQAIKKAIEDFRKTAEQARVTLKAAFAVNSTVTP